MIKFFRHIRQSLIMENKMSKYFKYAIGEIILVVIGILIALSINNWNENRKQRQEFNSILKTIKQDLKRDTLVAGSIIKYYQMVEENSLKILNKEINKNNFEENLQARGIVSIYKPFPTQTKGFEMAKNYSAKNEIKNDSIFATISQFYIPFIQIINDSNDFVKNEVFKNIEAYKKYDWYVDWTLEKLTPEIITYFSESEEYRKQVASHKLIAGKNHMLFITAYKGNAAKLIELIDDYLDNK